MNDRDIHRVDGLDHQVAHTGNVKDVLHKDGAADQAGKTPADHRQNGDKPVVHNMLP